MFYAYFDKMCIYLIYLMVNLHKMMKANELRNPNFAIRFTAY